MAAIQVLQQYIGSLFFKHTANIFISGPSGSGKTEFVKKMIEYKEDLFDIQAQQIVWCYKEWQSAYNILQNVKGPKLNSSSAFQMTRMILSLMSVFHTWSSLTICWGTKMKKKLSCGIQEKAS